MSRHRSVAVFTTSLAALLAFAGSARAQGPWALTIRPGGPLAVGACTPVRLELLDAAGREAPRNPAGARVSIADFDMTVSGAGVVGRYDGASAWSACACPASAGATATITATYPARSLAERARVPGVAFQSSVTVPVVAGVGSGVPVGCEAIKTTTVATGREPVPWTATLVAGVSALPIGACTPIQIDLRDATGKDVPRNAAGQRVSLADFDLTVAAGAGVVGQSTGAASWAACGCRGAAVGTRATITATYPARALAEGARVPGVAFQSSIALPLAEGVGTFNPPACVAPSVVPGAPAPGTPVSRATPRPVPPPTPAPASAPTAAAGAGRGATDRASAPPILGPAPNTPSLSLPSATPRAGAPLAVATLVPAPTGVTVTGTPASASLAWQAVPGVASYVVTRRQANAAPTQQTLAATNTGMYDSGLQPATAYTYTIRAIQADGQAASTDVVFTTPPAVNPAGFTATQTGDGRVQLAWQPVGGATYYVLLGPGAQGTKVAGATSYTVTGVPVGLQEWAVASYYEPGPVSSPGTAFSKVGLTVTAPTPPTAATPIATAIATGRYLVTITGLRAIRATFDDQLSRDGMGDEVYAAAYVRRYDRRTNAVAEFTSRRTVTYGDIKSFNTRVQAGTSSGTGGIRDTDPVPANSDPAERRVPAAESAFPLKLWEGTLTDGADALVLSPSLWEEDGSPQWYANWNQQMTAITSTLFASPSIQSQITDRRLGPLLVGTTRIDTVTTVNEGPLKEEQVSSSGSSATNAQGLQAGQGTSQFAALIAGADPERDAAAQQKSAAAGATDGGASSPSPTLASLQALLAGGVADRPIGAVLSDANSVVVPNATVVLTREIIEAGLAITPGTVPAGLPPAAAAAFAAGLPKPGVVTVTLVDGVQSIAGVATSIAPGRYELYIRVERLP